MSGPKVMLLIDADNVTADVVEQAVLRVIAEHGAAHIRRAYGTAEAAAKQVKLFKKLSIRPMVNIASGKNCTDIALAIDAIDLAFTERPDIAVIVSSDSDFAPLVLRLREKGCRVEGIGQEGKVGDETRLVYDTFVDLPHRKPRGKAAAAPKPAKAEPPAPPAKAPKAERTARAKPGKASASKAPAPAAKASPPAAPADDALEKILAALPGLRGGDWQPLNEAVAALRAAGLLGKTAASPKLFRKHAERFELQPDKQPSRVRLLPAA